MRAYSGYWSPRADTSVQLDSVGHGIAKPAARDTMRGCPTSPLLNSAGWHGRSLSDSAQELHRLARFGKRIRIQTSVQKTPSRLCVGNFLLQVQRFGLHVRGPAQQLALGLMVRRRCDDTAPAQVCTASRSLRKVFGKRDECQRCMQAFEVLFRISVVCRLELKHMVCASVLFRCGVVVRVVVCSCVRFRRHSGRENRQ